ncbi:hypothetical protein [Consotaella salsifontis]|nr:hypothetical protein [Consotaella salsifontis]
MGTTNTTSAVADFLKTDEATSLLSSAGEHMEMADEVKQGSAWIASLINDASSGAGDKGIFDEIATVTEYLEGAVVDLHAFVDLAHEALGHVALTREALRALAADPTEGNRKKLAIAAGLLEGSSVPMSSEDKQLLRLFLPKCFPRPGITLGNLHFLVNDRRTFKLAAPEAK